MIRLVIAPALVAVTLGLAGCNTHKDVLKLDEVGAQVAHSYLDQISRFKERQATILAARKGPVLALATAVGNGETDAFTYRSVRGLTRHATDVKHYEELAPILDERLDRLAKGHAETEEMSRKIDAAMTAPNTAGAALTKVAKNFDTLKKNEFKKSDFDRFQAFAEEVKKGIDAEAARAKKAEEDFQKALAAKLCADPATDAAAREKLKCPAAK